MSALDDGLAQLELERGGRRARPGGRAGRGSRARPRRRLRTGSRTAGRAGAAAGGRARRSRSRRRPPRRRRRARRRATTTATSAKRRRRRYTRALPARRGAPAGAVSGCELGRLTSRGRYRQDGGEAAQRLVQRLPAAAEVEAEEGRVAEGGPGRQRHPGGAARRRRVLQPEGAHVEPGQIRRLHVRHAHPRELCGDERLERVAVAAQVVEQPGVPVAAVPVGRLGGGDGEAAGERQQSLARPQEPPAQRLVGDDGEGEVQAGQVEGLARRHERDDAVLVVGSGERRGHVHEVVEDEVAVDLVADEDEVVAAAEVQHGLHLVPRHTRPSGLCGWQKKRTRVSGVTAASIASSGSSQRPSLRSAGTVIRRRPRWPGASRNGG